MRQVKKWSRVRGVARRVLVGGAVAFAAAEDVRTLVKLALSAAVILGAAATFGTAVRIFVATSGFGG